MTVKQHKEAYINGKSEVNIRSFMEYWNGIDPISGLSTDVISLRTTDQYVGIDIRKFSRNEVSNKTEKTINFQIEDDWPYSNFYTDPIIYQTVIFESDCWPTGIKTETCYLANQSQRNMIFRSADGSYFCGTFYINTNNGVFQSSYVNGLVKDNSGIKFNTILY